MRVVGGKYRGRQLFVPPGRDIRPTSNRVRESIFNILTQGGEGIGKRNWVEKADVLDGFAGTGAMGLEAISRGASKVTVIVILSPHWQTYVGTHFLGLPRFKSLSVDPIFPNLFRYHYDIEVDVKLAKMIHDEAAQDGLSVKMMENPDFRVDYGTITSCHLVRPAWDKPIVCISSNRLIQYKRIQY